MLAPSGVWVEDDTSDCTGHIDAHGPPEVSVWHGTPEQHTAMEPEALAKSGDCGLSKRSVRRIEPVYSRIGFVTS